MSTELQNTDALRQRLHQRLGQMTGRRTGASLRTAKGSMSKKDKNNLLRDLRKKGVKALTQKMGIKDPEVEKMVADMIRTGDAKDADDLVRRVTEIQAKRKMDQEATSRQREAIRMAQQPPPPEIQEVGTEASAIPTLPSANVKRKTLRPLRDSLLPVRNVFPHPTYITPHTSEVKGTVTPEVKTANPLDQWLQQGTISSSTGEIMSNSK